MSISAQFGRQKAAVVRKAKARRRLEQLRQLSASGIALQEAAVRIGMTDKGARSLLRRETGTSSWPIPAARQESAS